MPAILLPPRDRRSFLKISLLGAATVIAGCRTAPQGTRQPSEFHVALISDTHIPGDRMNGHRGFNPWENLRKVVPDVLATKPEGVIHCGDAARLEGKVEDYRELKALLEPVTREIPVYIALGNHDDRTHFLQEMPPAGGTAAPVPDRHVLILEHPVLRVLVLDSLMEPNHVPGFLGKAQRDWLSGFLSANVDRPTVLFVHHTLGDRDGDLLDADRLFAQIRPHRHVKAIFYGHSHAWELGTRDRVRLINLPAVGYNFDDKNPVGWVDARFRRTGVTLTLHAFGGNRAEDGRTVDVAWV